MLLQIFQIVSSTNFIWSILEYFISCKRTQIVLSYQQQNQKVIIDLIMIHLL